MVRDELQTVAIEERHSHSHSCSGIGDQEHNEEDLEEAADILGSDSQWQHMIRNSEEQTYGVVRETPCMAETRS